MLKTSNKQTKRGENKKERKKKKTKQINECLR